MICRCLPLLQVSVCCPFKLWVKSSFFFIVCIFMCSGACVCACASVCVVCVHVCIENNLCGMILRCINISFVSGVVFFASYCYFLFLALFSCLLSFSSLFLFFSSFFSLSSSVVASCSIYIYIILWLQPGSCACMYMLYYPVNGIETFSVSCINYYPPLCCTWPRVILMEQILCSLRVDGVFAAGRHEQPSNN